MSSQIQPQEYSFVDESLNTKSESFTHRGINENALKKYVKDISKNTLLKRADEQVLGLQIEMGRYVKKLYSEFDVADKEKNSLNILVKLFSDLVSNRTLICSITN